MPAAAAVFLRAWIDLYPAALVLDKYVPSYSPFHTGMLPAHHEGGRARWWASHGNTLRSRETGMVEH